MNFTCSLVQISITGNLDATLILRQYKLDLLSRFMEIESHKPNLTQKDIAQQLGYSDPTIER